MKSVFYAGAGIQSVLFFLNDGYLSATLACGSGVSPRTVRWGGTLLPQAVGRAMECNSSNRHLRWKQGAAVGAVADKTRTPFRREADVGCHNPGTFCVETAGRPEKLA